MSNPFSNRIPKGKDNPIIVDCSFTGDFAVNGLSNFTNIRVEIGDETYNSNTDSTLVFAHTDTQLRIKIGEVTQLADGEYDMVITGYTDVEYNAGYEFPELPAIEFYTR